MNISSIKLLSSFIQQTLVFIKVETVSLSVVQSFCDMIHFQICCCANDSLEFLIHFHFQTEVKEEEEDIFFIPPQND